MHCTALGLCQLSPTLQRFTALLASLWTYLVMNFASSRQVFHFTLLTLCVLLIAQSSAAAGSANPVSPVYMASTNQ